MGSESLLYERAFTSVEDTGDAAEVRGVHPQGRAPARAARIDSPTIAALAVTVHHGPLRDRGCSGQSSIPCVRGP